MDQTTVLAALSMLCATVFLVRYVGINFSLTSIVLLLLLMLHSATYFYYIHVWGPDSGYLDFFLEAAAGKPVLATLTAALGVMFVLVCIGVRFADLVAHTNGRVMRRAISAWKIEPAPKPLRERAQLDRLVLATTVLVLLPFALIDNQFSSVLRYFGSAVGEGEKLELRRELAGSSFYLYNLLSSNLFPFIAFCSLANRWVSRKPLGVLLLTFLVMMIISKLALLSKGPIAILVIQVFVLRKMSNSLLLPVRTLLATVAVIVAAFVAVVWLVNIGGYQGDLVQDILVYRTLMIPNESLVEYFSAIPHALDFAWGRQLSWVTGIFSTEPRMPTFLLVGEVHRGVLGSTTTAMFIADAWADFSWYGIAFFSLFCGFFLRSLDIRLLLRGRPNVWRLGALAMGHFGIYAALNTSFLTAMLTGGLIFVVPFGIWLPRWLKATRQRPISVLPKTIP